MGHDVRIDVNLLQKLIQSALLKIQISECKTKRTVLEKILEKYLEKKKKNIWNSHYNKPKLERENKLKLNKNCEINKKWKSLFFKG